MGERFDIPAGVREAGELTAAFDGVLRSGLARVSPAQLAALSELATSLAATPLGTLATEAVQAIASHALEPHHLISLAACREAVEGARAEALARVVAPALCSR